MDKEFDINEKEIKKLAENLFFNFTDAEIKDICQKFGKFLDDLSKIDTFGLLDAIPTDFLIDNNNQLRNEVRTKNGIKPFNNTLGFDGVYVKIKK